MSASSSALSTRRCDLARARSSGATAGSAVLTSRFQFEVGAWTAPTSWRRHPILKLAGRGLGVRGLGVRLRSLDLRGHGRCRRRILHAREHLALGGVALVDHLGRAAARPTPREIVGGEDHFALGEARALFAAFALVELGAVELDFRHGWLRSEAWERHVN